MLQSAEKALCVTFYYQITVYYHCYYHYLLRNQISVTIPGNVASFHQVPLFLNSISRL